jgi:hypothetical protein
MKSKKTMLFGKILMKIQPLKICIIDDVESYFNKTMLNIASADGNLIFERWDKIGELELKNLVQSPRDIVILDIKGIVDPAIGKDGFDIAKHLHQNTPSYIVTTSAHKFKLKNRDYYGDYVLTERLLTPIDFIDELNYIISDYLEKRIKPYQKLIFKMGLKLAKKALLN